MLLLIAVVLVLWIIVTALVENEHEIWAALCLGITVYAGYHFGVPVILFLANNPVKIAELTLIYFVMGACWGSLKWVSFVYEELDKFKAYKRGWLRDHGIEHGLVVPDNLIGAWKDNSQYRFKTNIVPQISEHKGDFTAWMTYWPFSLVWTLINDPIRRIFKAIYRRMASTMQKVSDRIFHDVTQELAREIPKP